MTGPMEACDQAVPMEGSGCVGMDCSGGRCPEPCCPAALAIDGCQLDTLCCDHRARVAALLHLVDDHDRLHAEAVAAQGPGDDGLLGRIVAAWRSDGLLEVADQEVPA